MNIKRKSFIRKSDSYKIGHWRQYPPETTTIASFFESRGGVFPEVTFFGLQYILKRHFEGKVVTKKDIAEAKKYFKRHFGDATLFNEAGWRRIVEVHGGRLPLVIRALPEGTTVPTRNVLITVENTDPELPWLTNYAETILSQVWYPLTVATQSRYMRKLIEKYLEETGDPSLISFKLHDFGYRGSTSDESAGIGGAAHLVNFQGTDNLSAIDVAADYYGEEMAGFSIPASEHSTMTSWGRHHEEEAYRNMLTVFPKGLISVVSDSYDIFNACKNIWGKSLKNEVLTRDGVLVIRPDSGHPVKVVLRVLKILGKAFGTTVNDKGYKMLHPKIRIIQGDGIDCVMLEKILEAMKKNLWSLDNITFGSGGGLLQKVNRDTEKCAFKCSAAEAEGTWRDVKKDPITDHGKVSKAGRLALVKFVHEDGEEYRTMREEEIADMQNELALVFKNGKMLLDQTFSEIRERAKK